MQIQSKLIIALLFLGVLLCTFLYFLMQWSFDRGMIHYVNQVEAKNAGWLVETLQDYYQEHGSWEALVQDRHQYHELILRSPGSSGLGIHSRPGSRGPGGRGPGGGRPELASRPPRNDRPRPRPPFPGLLDKDKTVLIGRFEKTDSLYDIAVDDVVVGWLVLKQQKFPTEETNLSIKNNLGLAFYFVGLALVFCVMFIGLPLSRHIVKPLQALADAAHALARGEYGVKLSFHRKDEIGKLARDFETLAHTLKSNELSRSRWIAGISHELRTPLAIILGEIDAMLEGIRTFNHKNLESLKFEIDQLTHLVNDLYELSNAEIGALRYNKSRVNMCDVVANGAQRFDDLFGSKGLQLQRSVAENACWVNADVQRLNQLINNLLVNEIKYAEENATVLLSLQQLDNKIVFSIEDTGPGVPDEHLDKLFDYIYRVEYSRNRKTGGSGLGLAICRKIVEAHGGKIYSSNSPLGGLKITIELPVDE